MRNLPRAQVGAAAVVGKSKVRVRGKDRRRVRGCTSSARDTRLGGRGTDELEEDLGNSIINSAHPRHTLGEQQDKTRKGRRIMFQI